MPQYIKICEVCSKEFETSRNHSRFCSKNCIKKNCYKNKPQIKKNCEFCHKEFETKDKKTLYCGSSCSNSACKKHSDVELICKNCKKLYTVPYILRTRKQFCSRSCAFSGEFNGMFGMSGELSPTYGQIPWTKGKSAQSEPKIKELGKKISIVLKEKFKNGEMSNAGENNPMFGRNHTDATKEKISEIISEKFKNAPKGFSIRGKYQSIKMNIEMIYRSSWELAVFKWLDKNEDVIKFINEPFKLKYKNPSQNYFRYYFPDLLIYYKDGTVKLVEIKPNIFLNYEINKSKFSFAQQYCQEKGLIFEVWTENQIKLILIGIDEAI